MFKICALWNVILWYEPNCRVRCAFGNVCTTIEFSHSAVKIDIDIGDAVALGDTAPLKKMNIYFEWIFLMILAGSWGKDTVRQVHSATASLCFWNSFFAFLERYQLKDPADQLWPKNVTSLTGGSNWRALIQKRHVTNRGVHLTCFDPKTSRYQLTF